MLQWYRNLHKRGAEGIKEYTDKLLPGGGRDGEALSDSTALGKPPGLEMNPMVRRMMERKRPAMEIFAKVTDLKYPENFNVGQRQAYKAQKYAELDDTKKATYEAQAVAEAADGNKIDPASAIECVGLHTVY